MKKKDPINYINTTKDCSSTELSSHTDTSDSIFDTNEENIELTLLNHESLNQSQPIDQIIDPDEIFHLKVCKLFLVIDGFLTICYVILGVISIITVIFEKSLKTFDITSQIMFWIIYILCGSGFLLSFYNCYFKRTNRNQTIIENEIENENDTTNNLNINSLSTEYISLMILSSLFIIDSIMMLSGQIIQSKHSKLICNINCKKEICDMNDYQHTAGNCVCLVEATASSCQLAIESSVYSQNGLKLLQLSGYLMLFSCLYFLCCVFYKRNRNITIARTEIDENEFL